MIANGFDNFTLQGSDGSTADAGGAAGGNAGDANNGNNNNGGGAAAPINCSPVTLTTIVVPDATPAPDGGAADDNADGGADEAVGGVVGGVQSTIAGLDFGVCVPTMKFVGGQNGRPADEFTFQAIDPLVALGQQEALNPAIITNRICDQLTNVCEANQAAKDACDDADAQIRALGTRDATTAETWNELLGFAGTDITGA